jgi:hypothetical protein
MDAMRGEEWNNGRMEYWVLKVSPSLLTQYSNIPLFHYSFDPVLQKGSFQQAPRWPPMAGVFLD